MANSTSSSRKAKVDHENNNGKRVSEIGPINSGSPVSDATGLRRSARETSSKKMTPSPSSIRKSERLGKQTSLSPVVRRKSERFEKQKMVSPLRRSKRTKNHFSLASPDSKSLGSSTSKQKKLKKQKSVKQLTFEAKEVSENEEHDAGASLVKNKRMNARAYRAMLKKKPKIDCPEESNKMDNLVQEVGDNNGGKTDECLKGSHLDCKEVSKNGMLPSDDAKESVNFSTTKDRGEIEATITAEISDKGIDYMPQKEFSAKIPTDDEKICLICKRGGQLLFCDGKGCNGCYHLSCLEPPMVDAPLGVWHCHLCVRKKIGLGVYSVSEGAESICDAREVEVLNVNGLTTEKQFLLKYKGLAHVHSRWVPENQLLLEAPLLLEKFNQKDQALSWKLEWVVPHRLLQKRALISAKQNGDARSGQAVDNFDCHYEWLVKWRGLSYEHASWELDNASFLRSIEGQRLIKDYEDRHQRAKRVSLIPKVDKKLGRVSSLSKLSQMPGGVSPGLGNNNLDAVNKLREHWHKGQNAIIIDDHDRIVKVVAFILSLHSDTYRPFLIISTSAALRYWEDEFSRWARSVNVVIYSGNKEIRKSIRKLEFYEEADCLLFQVLIVLPEIIIEDLDVLGGIEWEAIIVDDCQCFKVSSYLKQIKMLKTDLRILFSGQLKDSIIEYRNILALLDCQSYNDDNDELICTSSDCIGQLKDRLSSYVAYKCKSDSFRFVEYWVPVKISNVQLEQYCATLLSNSSILRSTSKFGVFGALHDILITTRKCCNHPYLVDETLQTLLIKGLSPVEFLDVGIKASGKLQILDSMLKELEKQGLRVLILFQSIGGSGKVSIGDILDDFMRQRFGPDSYERVDKYVVHSKKQNALKMFNNRDHRRFVFLLETNACLPSIKLSSVDTIIIFDSDWNPLNDIRSLQRITLDSKLERIKIFRLYSSFTVEERALILGKLDKPLDSNLQNISWSISQMLLMWGASWLFDYLKAFHDGKTDDLSVNSSSRQLSLQQVIQEFSSVLKHDGEDNDTQNCSVVLKVQHNGVAYRTNFSLPGESKFGSLDIGPSHLFWTKVLEGKNPLWKYSCSSSQRSRKRVQHFDGSGNRSDFENEDIVKKRSKVINNVVDQPSSKCEGEKLSTGNKEGNSGDLAERPRGNDVECEKVRKLCDEQRSLHFSLKSEIVKLSEVLLLPDKVKRTADKFLEYVMNHHHVNRESVSILQAFQISLCWTAASLVKHKIDHEASLMLAKQHLQFDCKKEEADYIYSLLRCLKKIFLYHTGNSNVTGSPKASDSELSNRNYSCVGLPPEVELAMKDISKSIKEIQKKCQKKLRKLLLKHEEDENKLNATYEDKKADLEKKYKIESAVIRSCTPNEVMRTEKLKALDIDYTIRIEDLNCQHEILLKDLETVHSAARQKFKDREATWVEDVKSWARDELLNILPSKEHRNGMEYLKTSEQDNGPKNMCLVSGDRIVEAMTGTGVGLSKTSEIISPVDILCSKPALVKPTGANDLDVGANEDHDIAQNACDSQLKIISMHFQSKEQNSDGATSMIKEGEGHENFSHDGCREKTIMDGSEKDITVDPPLSVELISDGGVLNVSDGELSSKHSGNLPLTQQQTFDGVSLRIHDGEIPVEAPETSCEVAECHNDREHQTDVVLLDKITTSDEQEGVSRTMNNNTLSQETPSLLSLPSMQPLIIPSPASSVNEALQDVTVGEMQNSSQQVEPVFSPVDVLPANQSNPESVTEPLEQMHQLPSAESLTSNQDMAGEMENFSQQVEPVSSLVDALPADQSNHDSVMELLERVQQLPSAQSLTSILDAAGEMQNSSQQVEPVCSLVNFVRNNQSNHESLIMEPPEQVQQLSYAEPPSSNQDASGEMQNSSQQVDPVSRQVDMAPANQSNHELLVMERLEQVQQLPSAESPNSNQDPSNFPLATGIELQPINEDSLPSHVPQSLMEIPNQAVVQLASNSEFDSHAPVGAFRMHSSDTRNVSTPSEGSNRLVQTATQSVNRMLPPLYSDPLKNELERIRKEAEQTIKNHEDMKLQLKSDCEREIEEIRRKYDLKLQETEVEFQQKKKSLDTSLNLVLMNKIWAEAFRSKCMDLKVPGASGLQQDASFAQQFVRLSRQQRDIRPPLVASPSCRPPASTLQHFSTMANSQTMLPPLPTTTSSQTMVPPLPTTTSSQTMVPPLPTTTSSQTMVPPLQAAYNTSGICSGVSARQPHINSILPPSGNHQAGSGFRTTPPHLQPYRPSTSMPDASVPTLPHGKSSQQAPNNIPAIPSFPHHPRPTLPTYISDPHNRVHRPEIPVGLPTPNFSAMEPNIDPNSQPSINALLRLSNVASLNQSKFGTDSSVRDNSAHQATCCDVVCLSDDD